MNHLSVLHQRSASNTSAKGRQANKRNQHQTEPPAPLHRLAAEPHNTARHKHNTRHSTPRTDHRTARPPTHTCPVMSSLQHPPGRPPPRAGRPAQRMTPGQRTACHPAHQPSTHAATLPTNPVRTLLRGKPPRAALGRARHITCPSTRRSALR
jgi:hypothetical protein